MFPLVAAETVHTTGVNAQGVLAVAVSVVVLMTPIFGLTIWILRSFIRDAVDKALRPIEDRLNSHDTRIATLEGVESGKRFMFEQRRETDIQSDRPSQGPGARG